MNVKGSNWLIYFEEQGMNVSTALIIARLIALKAAHSAQVRAEVDKRERNRSKGYRKPFKSFRELVLES